MCSWFQSSFQDEVIHLPSESLAGASVAIAAPDTDDEEVAATTAAAAPAGAIATTDNNMLSSLTRQQPVTLTPPDALFKSPEYPSLQIVVSLILINIKLVWYLFSFKI